MATPLEVLTRLEPDQFHQVVTASPKKFREEVFRVAGIRGKKGGSFSLKSPSKNEVRIQKLHDLLRAGTDPGGEILDELIRNYLYTRRPMLADALDFFEVPHDNGLTDEELDFLPDLDADKGRALRQLLCEKHAPADVDLYLDYMNIKHE